MKKLLYIACFLALYSCEPESKFEYEVNPLNVTQPGGDKNNVKTTTEFISIAYADLFGTSIPQSKLVNLSVAYSSFGDLKVIEDRIIRNLINDPAAQIPAGIAVGGDTVLFINNSYKKLFNRDASEFEKYTWLQHIRNNPSITPLLVYYVLMTSDEYRFY